MKKLALFILAITFGTATVFANPIKEKDTKLLRDEIVKLLENAPFEVLQEINATINFIITAKGEIIVTDVNTKNSNFSVESYVKDKLNYKKVTTQSNNRTRFFTMPLKITQKI